MHDNGRKGHVIISGVTPEGCYTSADDVTNVMQFTVDVASIF